MKDLTRITKYVYDLLLAIKSMEERLLQIKETQEEMLIAQQAQQTEKNPDRLIRASEVCKLLNIDRKTVTNWTNKGLLEPIDIAGIDFYWQSEVLKFKRS